MMWNLSSEYMLFWIGLGVAMFLGGLVMVVFSAIFNLALGELTSLIKKQEWSKVLANAVLWFLVIYSTFITVYLLLTFLQ
jgi:hypothetical protein